MAMEENITNDYLQIVAQVSDPSSSLANVAQLWYNSSDELYIRLHKNSDPGENVDHKLLDYDGNLFADGYLFADQAIAGNIVAVTDGVVALDLTLGSAFTCTLSQNTSWSTVAPTNGIGGERCSFVVDNLGGFTCVWAAGFTNVDSVVAEDTGIHVRTLQFDGTTWHQIASTEDGKVMNSVISGTHGDIPFINSSGGLDVLAAELGSGFLALNSRGPGLNPVWLDVQELIAFITGGANVLTLQVFDIVMTAITGSTAVDSSGAPISEDDAFAIVLAAFAAITAVDSSGAAATSNEAMSPIVPAFSFAVQVTPIVRVLTSQVFDIIMTAIAGITAVDSSGAPASEGDAFAIVLATVTAIPVVDSSGAADNSNEEMSPTIPSFDFSTEVII